MKKAATKVAEVSPSKDHKSLTEAQRTELLDFETTIETNQKNYFMVGEALTHICEKQLYKGTHRSFDKYCEERWDNSGTHIRRLMDAYAFVLKLRAASVVDADIPGNEYQIRLLGELRQRVDHRIAGWKKVVENAKTKNRKINASLITEVLAKPSGKKAKAKASKKKQTPNGGVVKALKLIEEAKKLIDQKGQPDWAKLLSDLEEALKT